MVPSHTVHLPLGALLSPCTHVWHRFLDTDHVVEHDLLVPQAASVSWGRHDPGPHTVHCPHLPTPSHTFSHLLHRHDVVMAFSRSMLLPAANGLAASGHAQLLPHTRRSAYLRRDGATLRATHSTLLHRAPSLGGRCTCNDGALLTCVVCAAQVQLSFSCVAAWLRALAGDRLPPEEPPRGLLRVVV